MENLNLVAAIIITALCVGESIWYVAKSIWKATASPLSRATAEAAGRLPRYLGLAAVAATACRATAVGAVIWFVWSLV